MNLLGCIFYQLSEEKKIFGRLLNRSGGGGGGGGS
jgi:hypothetical protein